MSEPSSSEPTRPAHLPTHAVWEAQHRLWRVGDNDDEGRWHGKQFTYRINGTLQGEFVYVAGKPDGRFRRYHPNGQVSIEGEHRLGAPVGVHTTYRSVDINDEAVHTCCLPPNARKLVTQYPDDGRQLDDYFDERGRRLQRDGSLYPETPVGVAATARLDLQRSCWVDGRYDRGKQHGCFSYWSLDGSLREVANYKQGQLDGLRERFVEDRCVERRMYKAGQPDGCAWERVARERFEDSTIDAQEGFYERGRPSGKWRYLDGAGQILATVDLGPIVDEVPLDDPALRTITHPDTLPLDPAREHVRRLIYTAHAGEAATLRTLTDSVPQLRPDVSEQILTQVRNETLEPPQYVAKLLHWLMRGVRAEHVFRALSAVFMREPEVGLQLLAVSSCLAPQELETRAAEILLLTGLGRISLVKRKIASIAEHHAAEASELAFNLRITYPKFDFWPVTAGINDVVSTELPTAVGQDLRAIRAALSKAATRLGKVRQALVSYASTRDAHEFELPPDLSHWTESEPTTLETYTFEALDADDVEQSDVVRVEESLELAAFSLPELMLQARTEWTTLCWLYFASGQPAASAGALELPTRLSPQPQFAAAITQSFQDLHRVTDQLRTSGIRSRARGVADCEWEGCAVSRLSRGLLLQAFAEIRERRAALYFAADDTCRSVWQDDLRAT